MVHLSAIHLHYFEYHLNHLNHQLISELTHWNHFEQPVGTSFKVFEQWQIVCLTFATMWELKLMSCLTLQLSAEGSFANSAGWESQLIGYCSKLSIWHPISIFSAANLKCNLYLSVSITYAAYAYKLYFTVTLTMNHRVVEVIKMRVVDHQVQTKWTMTWQTCVSYQWINESL